MKLRTTIKDKKSVLLFLIIAKILYFIVNLILLPDDWKIFAFDRNIHETNLIFEFVVFGIETFLYLTYYRQGNPVSFLSTLLMCFYVIPMNSTLSLSNYAINYYLWSNFYCMSLLVALGLAAKKIPDSVNEIVAERIWKNKSFLWIMRFMTIAICIGSFIYVYMVQGEISFSSFFDEDMYEKRGEFADFYLANTNGFVAYFIILWRGITATILLLCLYSSLRQKRFFDITLVLITYMALFSMSMEKSIFLQPVIVIFVYVVEKYRLLHKVNDLFVKGYSFLLGMVLIENAFREDSVLYTLFVKRLCYMPSYLNHTYYTFFEEKAKIWLTNDFFPLDRFVRFLLPTPWPDGMVKTISTNVYDDLIPSPNTGLFAEAYVQMGYLGILFYPIAVALIARVYVYYANNYGIAGAIILLSTYGLSLINTPLFSTMGMGKLLLFIIITWLLVKPITSKIKRI